MFTYKWIIENFEVSNTDTLQNIVVKIKWKYVAYDEENQEVGSEFDTLLLDNPSEESFTNFDNLTEELVISWVESKISKEDLETAIVSRYMQVHTPQPELPVPETVLPPWQQ